MPRPLQRMPLELGLQLNINELLRDGFIEPDQMTELKDCHWLDDDGDVKANAQIAANMTKGSTLARAARYGAMRIVADWIEQTIQLVACPRHFGGRQWYFVCPRQVRYVSVLWAPPGQRFFAGRKSWGNRVAYLSQYYGPGARAHYMAIKLCDRIGGPGASVEWDVPPKPKGMRWRTYERLSNRCEKYCDKATVLPREYRLAGDVV
jgi:hypothetical protein